MTLMKKFRNAGFRSPQTRRTQSLVHDSTTSSASDPTPKQLRVSLTIDFMYLIRGAIIVAFILVGELTIYSPIAP